MSDARSYAATTERLDADSSLRSAGDYLIYLFHIAAYELAAERLLRLSPAPRVLDYGSGTGYGAHHLARSGASIVGVDVSESAVAYAASRYVSPGLDYRTIAPVEQAPLPFADSSFDAVVSFQVIEHVPSVDAYLAEVARVLRPGGVFMCATPDRVTRLLPRQRPWNRWHLEEFDQDGLTAAVQRHLRVDEVMGMTAPTDVVAIEIRRSRLLKWASLPFTFPGAPERWRVAGLEGMRSTARLAGRLAGRLRGVPSASAARPASDPTYPFGLSDIVIAPGARPSTNIVLVASRPAPS